MAKQATKPATATSTNPTPTPVATIKVAAKLPAKLPRANSARGLWWAAIQAHNGKPLATFVAHVTANPPSLQPKGKYGAVGKVEPPMGWVNWFVRNGFITLG